MDDRILRILRRIEQEMRDSADNRDPNDPEIYWDPDPLYERNAGCG